MTEPSNEFEKAAHRGESKRGFLREFVSFLGENKKWWLAPILIVLLLFGTLIILAGTGAAPFVYTLF